MKRYLHKEKIDFLKSNGLCFSCLKQGHMSKACDEKMACQVCQLTHPTVLHKKNKDATDEARQKEPLISGCINAEMRTCKATGAGNVNSVLAIVPVHVKVKKGNKIVTTYAFLDPGSNVTFCTEKLMASLNVTGRKTSILLKTMGGERLSQRVIPACEQNIPLQEEVDKWPQLSQVKIPKIQAEVDLLIGTDVPKAMEPWQVVPSVEEGPYAVKTRLGWIVSGPLRGVNSHDTTSGLIQVTSNRISVATLDELWNHQQFKIDFPECQNDRVVMSREDIQFLEMVSQSAKLIEGHYSIGLPLRNTVLKMPNNRKVAEQRALNLKKKFIKNPQFHAEYSAFVEDWIVKDYAVKVPNDEISRSDGKVWYLPHHGVYHAKKLKIRVVFDCGASFQGTTLNDQLLQGPDLTSTLLGVITRFRQEVVAVMADVEAMFHQVQEEAVSMYSDLRAILHSGGFRLTKWVSNSRAVLSAIPVEERAEELRDLNLDLDMLPVERALGVRWCIESDNFKFRIIIQERPPTRRGILSVVGSIYDPLGILAPVVLTAKLILQDLCRLKLGWDDDIPEHLAKEWNSWLEDLHLLKDFGVSRCFKPRDFGKVIFNQLHHFADASQEGYGTVSYLLQENEENKLHVAFVMAKARVAPLKPLTIPRMELATTVLKYIGNRTSRFRTFVANRVEMILKLSEVRQWRHVNTAKNPADIASRGLDVRSFLRNESWIKGPDFLTKPEEEWPQNPDNHGDLTSEDPEVRKAMVNTTAVEEQLDTVQRFLEYYSSWNRLKKAVSWMLKLRNTLLTLCRKREEMNASLPQSGVQKKMKIFKESLPKTNLTVENLKEAELEIIRFCQRRKYSEEISVLRKGEDVKMSSHIYKLKPKLQEGILRVGGRLSRSAMPEEVKHPAILPKDFHKTELILRDIHECVGHSGRNHVLSKLRLKYWVPGAH
ncbi:hypothetical protein PO909_025662 [Leuciscus waleckii]